MKGTNLNKMLNKNITSRKISIETSRKICESLATRTPEALKDLGTLTTIAQFSSSPNRGKRPSGATRVQIQVYYVEKLEDNRLRCILTDRILPQTNEGRLDVAQLHREVPPQSLCTWEQ
ncbi:hypothetical protein JSO59_001160 [Riemerella anatipestifer]|uniref:hypothetical protein n=1 Tax=Riemerella anatipestifer TaxID=34085 RepID=UPI0030BD71BB